MNVIHLLAQTTPPPTTPPGEAPPGWLLFLQNPLFILLLGIVVMYAFVFRARNKEQRQRQDMLKSLKKNDRVQTIGGVLGSVIEVRDDEVLVKVDESNNTKIRFTRSAIHRVLERDTAPEKR